MPARRGVRDVQQDRSRRRRHAMLSAAVELINEGGLREVTHRAVSVRAGLPVATAGNYFRSAQDLIEQALQFHVRQRSGVLAAVLREAVLGAESLLDANRRVAEGLVGRTGVAPVQYEVYLEASRNPELRQAVAEAMQGFQDAAVPMLGWLGIAQPERAARTFLAVADGFALHRLSSPLPADEEIARLEEALGGVFAATMVPLEQLAGLLSSELGRFPPEAPPPDA